MPLPGEQSNPYLELEDQLAGGAIGDATAQPLGSAAAEAIAGRVVPATLKEMPVDAKGRRNPTDDQLAASSEFAAANPLEVTNERYRRAGPAPAEAPPQENPYLAVEGALDEQNKARDAATQELFDAAFMKAPDEHAGILEIARKTHVPADVVEQQFSFFKGRWAAAQMDPRRFREENPDMWGLLFDQPDKAPVVLQDEQIGGLARVVRGAARYSVDHPLLSSTFGAGGGGMLGAGEVLDLEDQLLGRQGTKEERTADFSKKKNVPYELDPSAGLTGIEKWLGKWAWVPVGNEGDVDLQVVQPGIPQAAWRNTAAGNETSRLGAERMALRAARASLNPETAAPQIAELDQKIWALDKRVTDMENQQGGAKSYGDIGFLLQTAVDVGNLAPSQLETMKGAGLVGGGLGTAAGAITYAGTRNLGAAWRAAKWGYKIGGAVGGALTSFTLESGSAFNEMIGKKLDDGSFVDENVATGASIIYGAIASAIEMEALPKMLGMWGPLGDAIAKGEGKAFAKGLLKDAKLRTIFADIGKRWLRGAHAEGQEEFLQQEAQNIIDYLGRSLQAGKMQEADPIGSLVEGAEIYGQTFSGTGAMGVHGAAMGLTTQLMARDR